MTGFPPDDARAAFEQLFRDTRSDLLAYVLRRSRSAEDAADTLAETYLVAWQKLDSIPTGESGRLWLFGVARNLLLRGASRRRSDHASVERLAAELRSAHLPHAQVEDDRSEALRVALAKLPERQREVVMLTAWEGLTPKEIAAAIGTPVNLVRVRLHRARARLKRELDALRATASPQPPGPDPPSGERRSRSRAGVPYDLTRGTWRTVEPRTTGDRQHSAAALHVGRRSASAIGVREL